MGVDGYTFVKNKEGEHRRGYCASFFTNPDDWEIYEEPKQKTKLEGFINNLDDRLEFWHPTITSHGIVTLFKMGEECEFWSPNRIGFISYVYESGSGDIDVSCHLNATTSKDETLVIRSPSVDDYEYPARLLGCITWKKEYWESLHE
jgi:hypothetical protein